MNTLSAEDIVRLGECYIVGYSVEAAVAFDLVRADCLEG
jgi:hypothetical protein